jgi:hypothetical protein
MHQIAAVKKGDAREELETTGGEVKVIPYAAKAGVRIKTGDDRIAIAAQKRAP